LGPGNQLPFRQVAKHAQSPPSLDIAAQEQKHIQLPLNCTLRNRLDKVFFEAAWEKLRTTHPAI
jgi:hypothetical protein